MGIIIDNNILFSLMKPDSTNSSLFDSINLEFFAPIFVIKEFRKYREECMRKSGLSEKDFKKREEYIFDKIELIEFEEYENQLERAEKICPDPDDVSYFALALKLDLPIWSNDTLLKNQNRVKILSTGDMIKLMF